MPFPLIPLAIMGGSALGGWLANRGKNKPTTSTTTSTSAPTIDPAFSGLQSAILPNIMARLQQKSFLPEGLSEINTAGINQTYEGAQMGLENQLSARGLNTSPVAGAAMGRLQGNRAGEISRMKQTLPILNEQMRRESLEQALRALALGRMGQTANSTTTGTGPATGANGVGAGISSAASMLGFLYGSGMLGGSAGGGGGFDINRGL